MITKLFKTFTHKEIGLIILDMYGTIIGSGVNCTPRNGFTNFMQNNRQKTIVVATDSNNADDSVHNELKALGANHLLRRIYLGDNMSKNKKGQLVKNLGQICEDFKIKPCNAVMIGDSPIDKQSAKTYGVRFIEVPYYEEINENFSFNMIDLSQPIPKCIDLSSANCATFRNRQ